MREDVKKTILDFFQKYKLQSYSKGEKIVEPFKHGSSIFCLTEGSVRCFTTTDHGVELSINVFRPISFFPLVEILTKLPNRYTYEALTKAKIYQAPQTEVLSFIKLHPNVSFDLLQRIYIGLDGYLLRIESLLSGEAYHRILTQLVIQTRRFGPKIQLTHADLAALTGLSRETVTRELGKMKKMGLLESEGRTLIVKNIQLLEKKLTL